MTEEQTNELAKQIEIEIGDERQFLLVIVESDGEKGTEFRVATNANKANMENILKIIDEDLKPQVEAM
jgi:hypothetical protein